MKENNNLIVILYRGGTIMKYERKRWNNEWYRKRGDYNNIWTITMK